MPDKNTLLACFLYRARKITISFHNSGLWKHEDMQYTNDPNFLVHQRALVSEHGDAGSFFLSVSSLICCENQRDIFQGWWNDMTALQKSSFQNRALDIPRLFSDHFFFFFFVSPHSNFWLACETMACKDIQTTCLQCPLTGFWLITEIPLSNAYLMRA